MKQAKLLWMDLEMTGLDPEQDRILEVAVLATDWDFREVARYEAVVHVDPEYMEKQMSSEFWEGYPEVRKALQVQNETGRGSQEVEEELTTFVKEYFSDEEPVILAGNSIHQDRKFIDREWPEFAKKLHYRMLDVSAWKVVFDGKYRKRFAKPEAHRALEDIKGSIEELKYYLKKVKI